MLTIPDNLQVYVYSQPTDMRRSFDRLEAMVKEYASPRTGSLFVFISRRKDRIKLLYWDEDGYALWYKRLESGTFKFEFNSDSGKEEISGVDLKLFLAGMEFKRIKFRKKHNQSAA